MAHVMRTTIEQVTFKDVQGLFRRYVHLFGDKSIPLYLREDISKSNFKVKLLEPLN
jgi:hypothetical protein